MNKLFSRFAAMLTALMLLFTCIPAVADTSDGVFQLMAGGQVIGTAVVWSSDSVLLTGAEIPEGANLVLNIGGQGVPVESTVTLEGGLTALLVSGTNADLHSLPASITTDGLRYTGVDSNGITVSGNVQNAAATLLNGHSALVFTADEELLPGAVLLDADGRLAGIMVCASGEAQNRYTAYTVESLFWITSLTDIGIEAQPESIVTDVPEITEVPATEAPATEVPATEAPATEVPATEAPATEASATEAPATEAPATEAPATEAPATEAPATEAPATVPAAGSALEETVWLEGFTVTEDKGALLLDWSGCTITDLAADSAYVVFVSDTGNNYYSYYPTTEQTVSIPCAANRTYRIWVEHGHGDVVTEVKFPDNYTTFTTSSTSPYTDHSLQTTSFYIGTGDANISTTDVVDPLTPITVSGLMQSSAVYLMVTNTYEVTEQIECRMSAVLFAPDGSVYMTNSGFLFDPTLCENDTWNMDITTLFDNCARFSNLPSGTYTLILSLDGQMMEGLEFTL